MRQVAAKPGDAEDRLEQVSRRAAAFQRLVRRSTTSLAKPSKWLSASSIVPASFAIFKPHRRCAARDSRSVLPRIFRSRVLSFDGDCNAVVAATVLDAIGLEPVPVGPEVLTAGFVAENHARFTAFLHVVFDDHVVGIVVADRDAEVRRSR